MPRYTYTPTAAVTGVRPGIVYYRRRLGYRFVECV